MNNLKNENNQRNSNLELYRIFTMLLIVAHHYVVNSGLTNLMSQNPTSMSSFFLYLFGAWGKTGINCFVLITGYFMCKSNITLKKFVKLLCEVLFYNIVIYFIFLFSGYQEFSLKGLFKAIVPIYSVSNNFTSCFLLFYLTIPFLNILIKNLSEKQHVILIILGLFIYTFFGTVPKLTVVMNYVSWFIVLYFIASFTRLYHQELFARRKLWGLLTLASFFISVISVILGIFVGNKIDKNIAYFFVTDSNTFLCVINGITSFLFFKNINIKQSKIINAIGSTTFGVLLIHANSDVMRQWLWKDLLRNMDFYGQSTMILHAFICVITIFIICSILDLLRQFLIEKPFLKVYDKIESKLLDKFKKENS